MTPTMKKLARNPYIGPAASTIATAAAIWASWGHLTWIHAVLIAAWLGLMVLTAVNLRERRRTRRMFERAIIAAYAHRAQQH